MLKKLFLKIVISLVLLTPAFVIGSNMDSFSSGFKSFLIFLFMISIIFIIVSYRRKRGDKPNA